MVSEVLLRILDYTKDNGESWEGFKQDRSLSRKGRKSSEMSVRNPLVDIVGLSSKKTLTPNPVLQFHADSRKP